MSAQSTNPSDGGLAFGVASGTAGAGILLLALFSMALPIVVLTTVALVPLLVIGLVPVLIIAAVATPVALVRRLARRGLRSPKRERSESSARRDGPIGRAATVAH
jgi:hypothetical protein